MGAWQATCPQNDTSVTGCKKSIALSSNTPEEKTRCMNLLKLWCLQAGQCDRRSTHAATQPRSLELVDEAVLQARLATLPAVPAVVRTDAELDAMAAAPAVRPKAKAKGGAQAKAKDMSRAKSKATSKASLRSSKFL